MNKKYKVQYWKKSSKWGAINVNKFFSSFKEAFKYFQSLNKNNVYLDNNFKNMTLMSK